MESEQKTINIQSIGVGKGHFYKHAKLLLKEGSDLHYTTVWLKFDDKRPLHTKLSIYQELIVKNFLSLLFY